MINPSLKNPNLLLEQGLFLSSPSFICQLIQYVRSIVTGSSSIQTPESDVLEDIAVASMLESLMLLLENVFSLSIDLSGKRNEQQCVQLMGLSKGGGGAGGPEPPPGKHFNL